MAFSSSSFSKNRRTIRSISLPTRSHPTTHQSEEELANFRTWQTTSFSTIIPDAATICNGLIRLERLYTCVDDLLNLPLTQQTLSHEKLVVDEFLDRSMRLLDICSSIRDVVSLVKEHVRAVQSALRRRKLNGEFNSIIDEDVSFLKKLKKDTKKGVAELKQIDGSKLLLINLDSHLASVIRVLRDVSEVSIFFFGLLFSFLSVSIRKPKSTTKWSIVSKFIQKGSNKDEPRISVEALDCDVEGVEDGLECMFRRLIRTRSSLLNIFSH